MCVYKHQWHQCSGCMENLAVRGCVWAERLHGPQAWMSHSIESRIRIHSRPSAAALQDSFAIPTPQLLWHARGHITLEADAWSPTSSPDEPGLSHCRCPADSSRLKASLGPDVWRTYGWRYHVRRTFLQHVGDPWILNVPHELFTQVHMWWDTA